MTISSKHKRLLSTVVEIETDAKQNGKNSNMKITAREKRICSVASPQSCISSESGRRSTDLQEKGNVLTNEQAHDIASTFIIGCGRT